ncbi:hypothetical protein R84B8_03204 [Treponema sp. R8-4-B8]
MKRSTGHFALIFGLLLIAASNNMAYAQTDVKDELSVSPESELNYAEKKAQINNVVFQKLSDTIQFIKKCLLILWRFFLKCPLLIKSIIILAFLPACFIIISSQVIGLYQNRDRWEKHPYYNLMYSYFVKSGTLQRKESYRDAHSLLYDHKWSWISFAGLAYRLGNYDNKSVMHIFALTFVYIPLFVLGFIEMVFRISLGTVWLVAFNLLHKLALFITKLITYLLVPAANIIDKFIQKTQYCPHCYDKFSLPKFICPSCGKEHDKLIPGKCGVLFARCACNKVFIPCVSFTGRSFLASKCPSCSGELYTANAKHFSVAVVGGDNVGKTAFISAFSNLYTSAIKHKYILTIKGKPENYFNELIDMFNSGVTPLDTESRTYSIIHRRGKIETDNLVFYKTFAEYIMSEKYSRSPKYFRFCDGIILIIDTSCSQTVKEELAIDENSVYASSYSPDNTNEFVVQFIYQFNTIKGSASGELSPVPVAVLINKADIDIVKCEIGMDKIKALYKENPSAYNNNENDARDQICKEYMTKIGLINVLNNIDATFSNVSYFPVSAVGHKAEKGKAFTPVGIMEPLEWLANKGRSRIAGLLSSSVKYISNKR